MKTSKQFSRNLIAAFISGSLLFGSIAPANASGIPVFDGASVAQAIVQVQHLKEQIDNQISQIKELENQVKAVTGSRNLGQIFKDAALDQVPDEWKSIYSDIKNKDYKSLTGTTSYQRNSNAEDLIKSYRQTAKAIADSERRTNNLLQMMNQINQAQDVKAAADLQNRIAIEQARINNNQLMLDMSLKMTEQRNQIRSVQQKNIIQCQIRAKSRDAQRDCGRI